MSGSGAISTISSNQISNTGTLSTTGRGSDGIFVWAHGQTASNVVLEGNAINNASTISTGGASADGIRLFANSPTSAVSISGNSIVNSGSIYTKSASADAILIGGYGGASFSSSNNTISNTGTLISAYGDAIDVSTGSGNTLNLSTEGFIAGGLALGTGDTVNLVSTTTHSTFWTFAESTGCGARVAAHICTPSLNAVEAGSTTFNTSGSMPWFHSSGDGFTTYATFDASGVAARGNMLADMAWMNSGFMQQGLTSLQASASTTRFWATAGDNHQDYEGNSDVPDQKVNVAGGAFGAATRLRPNTIGAIMVAYNNAKVTLNGLDTESYDNTASGFSGGVFLRHSQSGFDVDAGINLGWTNNDVKRFVNDNLASNGYASGGTAGTGNATLGKSWNEGDYSAFWISPELAIAYDLALGDVAMLTPSARLRYAMESAQSYTEDADTGRIADADVSSAAKVGDYTTGVFEADLAVELSKAFDWGQAGLSGGYILRQMTGDDKVEVSMLDQTLDVPVNTSNFYAPYLAANIRWAINEQFDFAIDGRTVFSDSNVGYDVKATLGGSF